MAAESEMFGLALQCHQLGRLQEAERLYRETIAVSPTHAEAYCNLGVALQDGKRLDEAMACYGRALELRPGYAEAYNNLGTAFQEKGQVKDAEACYRLALERKADFAEAQANLGDAFKVQERMPEAVSCYRRALELRPNVAAVQNSLASVLQTLGEHAEAVAHFQRALELTPNLAEAHHGLGFSLQELGRLDEAVVCHRRALELEPSRVEAHHDLGSTFYRKGRYRDAMACYKRAVELKPDLAEAQWNLATLQLLLGDFERGWPQHEWRWKTGQIAPPKFPQPAWDRQPLHGKTILLYTEQGFGDVFQFIRYVTFVHELGASVIVGCPKPLIPLLRRCPGIDAVVGEGDKLPPFDVHASILSLPHLFKTTLETIPFAGPYLFAAPELVALWGKRFRNLEGFRIGINWHGREGQGIFRRRDIPVDCFSALAEIPGVKLISLQKGDGCDDLATKDFAIFDPGSDFDTAHGAFMDTAAIMKNLDLVITSDTSVCHLAGALAVPVWTLLSFVPNWRWLLDRGDSPWYPTMRLFRQHSPGDWTGVFTGVKTAITQQLSSTDLRG